MMRHQCVASTAELLAVAETIARDWARLGVRGHLLARNLDTGDELGFDAGELVPIASVVKVPIALTVLDQIAQGRLTAARQLTVDNERASLGPTGTASFRYPATLAAGDLVMLMLTISDNAAADRLLELVGLDRVTASLAGWGCRDIRVHRIASPAATAELRRLMAMQVFTHRLPATWASAPPPGTPSRHFADSTAWLMAHAPIRS